MKKMWFKEAIKDFKECLNNIYIQEVKKIILSDLELCEFYQKNI
jgi:hypothetical protein